MDNAQARAYGNVVLTHPISHRMFAFVFVAIALLIVAFFMQFSTTRKVHCGGLLLPSAGVLRVLPTQAGRIVESRAKEGERVRAGDVLFVLADDRSTTSAGGTLKTISSLVVQRRDSLQAELLNAKQQLAQRLATENRRIINVQAEANLLRRQRSIQAQRVALSEQALQQFSELHAKNYLSSAQVQQKQAEVLDQRQRLTDIERALMSAKRELADAQHEKRDIELSAEREVRGIERNISMLEQEFAENEARREILVRAPIDGTITAITAERGQFVTSTLPLASLLPSGAQLEAELYVPSRSIGFIRMGMPVMLRYQAFPYQKFGQHRAHVREIANTSLRADELAGPLGGAAGAEPLYRIRLSLEEQSVRAYGRQMPLKSGMAVDASVMLEERRLYEWILEPLFSITGRL